MPNADGGAAVTLLRGSDNAYVTVSAHGLVAAATGFVVPADSSFQGLAARERRPKLIHDGMTDERLSARVRAVNKQWDTRSWAVIPLMYHGDPIGSLLLAASAAVHSPTPISTHCWPSASSSPRWSARNCNSQRC